MRLIGVTQQLAGVMRRKTYGCVVLYEDKHSKMAFKHLGVFIKVKNTNVQKRGGAWGLLTVICGSYTNVKRYILILLVIYPNLAYLSWRKINGIVPYLKIYPITSR